MRAVADLGLYGPCRRIILGVALRVAASKPYTPIHDDHFD